MKKIKMTVKILIIFLIFIIINFCDNEQEPDKAVKDDFTPLKTVDAKNREIIFKKEVNKIITAYKPARFFVFALNAQNKLVTSIKSKPGAATNDYLHMKLYPKINQLPSIKAGYNNLSIEEIVSHKPDLVILFPKKSIDIADRLENLGVKSVIIEPENREKIIETIDMLGKVLDRKEEADKLLNKYRTILSELEEKTKGVNKKKVYYIDSEILNTISGDMLQSQIIEDAGGINVTKDIKGWKQIISYEQLNQWNPDVFILSSFSKISIEKILNNPKLSEINAIKDKEIYYMPSNLDPWDYPVPNSILGSYWLAHILYPEKITKDNLDNTVNDFYKDIYGKSFQEMNGDYNN